MTQFPETGLWPPSGNVIRAMGKDVSDPDLLTRVLRGSCRPAEMKGDREEGRHDEVAPESQENQEGVPQGEGVSKGPKLLGRRASQLPLSRKGRDTALSNSTSLNLSFPLCKTYKSTSLLHLKYVEKCSVHRVPKFLSSPSFPPS